MAEIVLIKTSEKVIIWLHRIDRTQQWLANELNQTRQSISNKISDNCFTIGDIMRMKSLGCPL